METESIDKLFLELSQITKAKTKKEIVLENILRDVLKAWSDQARKIGNIEPRDMSLFKRAWFLVTGNNE